MVKSDRNPNTEVCVPMELEYLILTLSVFINPLALGFREGPLHMLPLNFSSTFSLPSFLREKATEEWKLEASSYELVLFEVTSPNQRAYP